MMSFLITLPALARARRVYELRTNTPADQEPPGRGSPGGVSGGWPGGWAGGWAVLIKPAMLPMARPSRGPATRKNTHTAGAAVQCPGPGRVGEHVAAMRTAGLARKRGSISAAL